MLRLLVGLAIVALGPGIAPGIAFAGGPATGVYENGLLVGYDPATGLVTGYFAMTRDGPPGFSCIFYLKGRLAGASAPIATYFPETPTSDVIKGELTLIGPKSVRISLPTDHGGCGNVWSFADKDQPADFQVDSPRAWLGVRVAKSDKVYFYPTAGAAAHGRAYMVKGDGFGVVARQTGWVEADFEGGRRSTWGWVREADLYPVF